MKELAKYSTKRGDVWLVQGEKYFAVVCHTLTVPGMLHVREFAHLSYEGALEKFAQMQAELVGRKYVAPKCKYPASRKCLCNSRNCPEQIGGPAYWEIFSNSCCYKVR